MHRVGQLVVVVFLLMVVMPPPVKAQTASVTVNRRDADITIQNNGDVRINETWEVKFLGGPFTYGFRGIGLDRLDYVDGFEVAEGSKPYQLQCNQASNTFTTYVEKGQQFVKWFFPPSTNQTRTFNLQYIVHGALRIYDAGDQLWWVAIEGDRSYTIETSTITVHLPVMFQADQIRAAVTSGPGTATVRDGQTAVFTSSNLRGGTELEIRIQFPHGTVASKPSPWQVNEDKVLVAEQQRRALEEKLRISEERRGTLEGELRTSEERRSAFEDKLRVSEEQRGALEVALRTSEEGRRTLEGQLSNLQSASNILTIVAGIAVTVAASFGLCLLWIALRQRNRSHSAAT